MKFDHGAFPELSASSVFAGNAGDHRWPHEGAATATWRGDSLDRLSQPFGSISELFAAVSEIFRAIGLGYCSLHVRFPRIVGGFPADAFFSSYPAEWRKIYEERSFEKTDPVAAEAFRMLRPVLWSNALFRENQLFWHAAQSCSVHHRWALAKHGEHSEMVLISLASDTPADPEALFDDNQDLPLVACAAASAAVGLLLSPSKHAAQGKLTRRERDVLRWSAAGKTSSEIASILGVTERTVAFHVGEVTRRLNATN